MHLLEEIEVTVVPLRGFNIDADECLSAGPTAVRHALRRYEKQQTGRSNSYD